MNKKCCRTYIKVTPSGKVVESVNGILEHHILQFDSEEESEDSSHLEVALLPHADDGIWIKKCSE